MLRTTFANRKLIVIGGSVPSLAPVAVQLESLGAAGVLILATNQGTGERVETSATICSLDVSGANVSDLFAAYRALLTNLPPHARAAVDRFDPTGQARVVNLNMPGSIADVAGRPLLGGAANDCALLEDKTRVDSFWDAAGIRRPPSRVIRPEHEEARAALRELDRGHGTAWAADSSGGHHSGAGLTRWVRSNVSVDAAVDYFRPRCSRLRITPFIEGLPARVHGIVCDSGVAVFRPMEIVTLRRTDSEALVFGGASTFWDPPDARRHEMRSVARRAGEVLGRHHRYRGAYTVDGICTDTEFLPNEMNMRGGFSLSLIARALDLPLPLLALAIQSGAGHAIDTASLETLIVDAADATRTAFVAVNVPSPPREPGSIDLSMRDGVLVRAGESERPIARMVTGASEFGGFMGVDRFTPEVFIGKPVSRFAVDAARIADEEFGLGIGPLEAPRWEG